MTWRRRIARAAMASIMLATLAGMPACTATDRNQTEVAAKSDYENFDQQYGSGWRKLAEAGKYLDAARAIDDYLANRTNLENWQRINLRFHAGQLYAHANQTEIALARFRAAINPQEPADSPMLWNAYVKATIAFLEQDLNTLVACRDELANGPTFQGQKVNLNVVDTLIANFDKPYAEAYSSTEP